MSEMCVLVFEFWRDQPLGFLWDFQTQFYLQVSSGGLLVSLELD